MELLNLMNITEATYSGQRQMYVVILRSSEEGGVNYVAGPFAAASEGWKWVAHQQERDELGYDEDELEEYVDVVQVNDPSD